MGRHRVRRRSLRCSWLPMPRASAAARPRPGPGPGARRPGEAGRHALELRPGRLRLAGRATRRSGWRVLRSVRAARPNARTLFLTPRAAEAERLAALEAGRRRGAQRSRSRASELAGRLRLLARARAPGRVIAPAHRRSTSSWTSTVASCCATAPGSTCGPRRRACSSCSPGRPAASSPGPTSSSGSGGPATPVIRGPSTSTCAGCAPRSSPDPHDPVRLLTVRGVGYRLERAGASAVNRALTIVQRRRSCPRPPDGGPPTGRARGIRRSTSRRTARPMRTTTRLGAAASAAAVLTLRPWPAQPWPRTSRAPSTSTARRPSRPSRWPSPRTSRRPTRASASPSARRAPATASRSSSASTTATSRTPRAPSTRTRPRSAPRTASSTRRAQDRLRRHRRHHLAREPHRVPEQVRPVGALRRRVERHHRRGRTPRPSPTRWARRPTSPTATSPSRPRAPSRAPTTRSSSWPSAPPPRSAASTRRPATPCRRPTSAPPTTASSSRASRSSRPRSASSASPTPTHAGDAVKIVAVDEGEGCVAASPETVADGTYALSRPLFIYPALNRLESNPAIAPFVDYYLSDEGIANVSEVGYVAAAGRGARGHPRRLGRGVRRPVTQNLPLPTAVEGRTRVPGSGPPAASSIHREGRLVADGSPASSR